MSAMVTCINVLPFAFEDGMCNVHTSLTISEARDMCCFYSVLKIQHSDQT